jgi:hypothetical protein
MLSVGADNLLRQTPYCSHAWSCSDIEWEDDVEDKDDSDWVECMDNDSVMSDDSESDE